MKDERYWPVIGTWLKDTAEAPPDARETARRVTERLPRTAQLRRRWWLPLRRRVTYPPPGHEHSSDQEPIAIPDASDHRPFITGRTRFMPSPARAMIAGTLIFALGGALIVARPFEQEADQQVAGQPAASFTDSWSDGTVVTATQTCVSGTSPLACTYTSSDSRVAGSGGHVLDASVPVRADEEFTMYLTDAWIESPGGNWTGHHYLFGGVSGIDAVLMLAGDGAYEGWSFVAFGSDPGGDADQDLTGVVYRGPLPPVGAVPIPTREAP